MQIDIHFPASVACASLASSVDEVSFNVQESRFAREKVNLIE